MIRRLARMAFRIAPLMLMVLGIHRASADTVTIKITHISGESIYLDGGREVGLREKQKGTLEREGEGVAQLEILSLSDRSASCRLLTPGFLARVGDEVIFSIEPVITPVPSPPSAPPIKPAEQHARQSPKKRVSIANVSGRIGIQTYSQNDRTNLNYDFYQPSLVVRLSASSLFGSHYAVNLRLRSRRIYRPVSLRNHPQQEWDNRIYEMSLSYANSQSPVRFQAGRILAGKISGIGCLDGIFSELDMSGILSMGAFGGTRPDLRTTSIQSQTRKAGVFAAVHSAKSAKSDVHLTAALAGEYTDGRINREFIYQQAGFTRSSQLAIFQSAEINVNRGWRKRAEDRTFALTNLLANLRFSPARFVAFSTGYDGYANYRTWETRETPDSLFDEAMRRGYRAGIEVNLPWGFRTDLRGTLRDDGSGDHLYRSGSFALGAHRILRGRIRAGMKYSTFESRFTNGGQPSAELSIAALRGLELRFQTGRTIYDYHDRQPRSVNDWWRSTLDIWIGRRFYGSAYYEFYYGTNEETARLFVEMGFRI